MLIDSNNTAPMTSTNLDLHALMSALQNAPDLDLLRLRTAIDQLLQNPKRILAIRTRLHTGQELAFFSLRDQRLHQGRAVQLKPDQVLIREQAPGVDRLVWIEYAAIQLDASAQTPAPPQPKQLTRADFAIGDSVGFEGRDLIQHIGTIVRLNTKTATVACPEGEWRVSYALLNRVVNL